MVREMTRWSPKVAEARLRREALASGLTTRDLKRHGFKVNRDYAYLPQLENGQWHLLRCEYYFTVDGLHLVPPGSPEKPALPDIVIVGGCAACQQPIPARSQSATQIARGLRGQVYPPGRLRPQNDLPIRVSGG